MQFKLMLQNFCLSYMDSKCPYTGLEWRHLYKCYVFRTAFEWTVSILEEKDLSYFSCI